jgi:hypothetical protein
MGEEAQRSVPRVSEAASHLPTMGEEATRRLPTGAPADGTTRRIPSTQSHTAARRLPAMPPQRDMAPYRWARARKAPALPPGTIIIPASGGRSARRTVPQLSGRARGRATGLSALGAVVLVVALLFAFTPLGNLARPVEPWAVQGDLAVFPTATPAHPVANGEQAFVCVALYFARMAQQRMQTGPRAQPHPWYLSVILAQWGIEQGWSIPGYTGYNWGNSSALDGYPSVPGTNQPGSPSRFAYATTAEMGVEIYVAFIQNGLYNGVAAAWSAGPVAQALALGASPWDAGHYTGTGHPGSSLLSMISYYHLTRLDQPGATCDNA